MTRALLCGVLVAAAVGGAAPTSVAQATTAAGNLDTARQMFRQGQYTGAIPLLTTLLYPKTKLTAKIEIAEAHVMLAVCYFETGNRQGANQEFDEALFIDITTTLDPLLYSTGAREAFRARKEAMLERERQAEESAQAAKRRADLRRILDTMVVIEKRKYYLNFVPFGAGQFQNGHTRKGTFFAVAEAVTGGTSFALWMYQVVRFGLSGSVPPDEVDLVNTIQVAQLTTGVAFFGLHAWGTIDSLSHYEPTIERKPDASYLEEFQDLLEEEDDTTPAPSEPTSTLRVIPVAGPNAFGLDLRWEF